MIKIYFYDDETGDLPGGILTKSSSFKIMKLVQK